MQDEFRSSFSNRWGCSGSSCDKGSGSGVVIVVVVVVIVVVFMIKNVSGKCYCGNMCDKSNNSSSGGGGGNMCEGSSSSCCNSSASGVEVWYV